jgi:molecular chaperone HtpG
MKWENTTFKRVDADIVDNLIDTQEKHESVLSNDEEAKLKEWFGLQIPEMHVTVDIKGLSNDAAPVVATRPEFMRRMKDMSRVGGGLNFYGSMPDTYKVAINANHKIVEKILNAGEEQQTRMARQAFDLALLSQGMLKGADLTAFVERSVEVI